ncbi:MAG: methyltransferase [Deltaproteobacteria bacterium]|nr:MAG: methyltransferase [Deltaproteobacteria bacterium]
MIPTSNQLWSGDTLSTQFERLSALLARHQDMWKPAPFQHPVLPWTKQHPDLTQFLVSLSQEEVDGFDASLEDTAKAFAPYFPEAQELYDLAQIGAWPHQTEVRQERGLYYGVPALKVGQIHAFASCLSIVEHPLLEWCSGKGHLSRILSTLSAQPGDCLEIQPHLCEYGAALAERQQVKLEFYEVDCLQPEAGSYLHPYHHAVALHACGHLHRRLLEHCVAQHPQALSLSPCCYFIGESTEYQPFSQHAAQSDLSVTRDNLRLATREVVTARPSRVRYRDHNNRWRMGFDLLQREVRGVDEYLPAPSVQRQMLKGSFEAFCRHIAHTKNIELPEGIDYNKYEQWGAKRYQETYAFELVRSLFRRPLELWLVLDRALFLQEHGYNATVGVFCERSLTPRNLLIHAERAQ